MLDGPSNRIVYGADTRTLGLLLGCALGLALADERLRRVVAAASAPLAAPLVAMTIVIWAWLETSITDRDTFVRGVTVVDLAAVLLVAHLVLNRTVASRLFESRPAVWVGQRSYGIYLYHFPIVVLAADEGRFPLLADDRLQGLFVLCASLAVASLSYRFVEQPFRGHGRRPVTAPTPRPALTPCGAADGAPLPAAPSAKVARCAAASCSPSAS